MSEENDLNSQPQVIDQLFNDNDNADDFFNTIHHQQPPQVDETSQQIQQDEYQIEESIPQDQNNDDLFGNDQLNDDADDFFNNQINMNQSINQDISPLDRITDVTRIDHIEEVGQNLDEHHHSQIQEPIPSVDENPVQSKPEYQADLTPFQEQHFISTEQDIPVDTPIESISQVPIESTPEQPIEPIAQSATSPVAQQSIESPKVDLTHESPMAQSTQNPIVQESEEVQEVPDSNRVESQSSKLDDLFAVDDDDEDGFLEELKASQVEKSHEQQQQQVVQEEDQQVEESGERANVEQSSGGDEKVEFLEEIQLVEEPVVEEPVVENPVEKSVEQLNPEIPSKEQPKSNLFADDKVDFFSELKPVTPPQEQEPDPLDKLASLDLDDDLLLDEEFLDEEFLNEPVSELPQLQVPQLQVPQQNLQPQPQVEPRMRKKSYVPVGPMKSPIYTPPSASAKLAQSNDFVKNLEQSKKKHDAYDFPDELMVNTTRPSLRHNASTSSASVRYGPPSGHQSASSISPSANVSGELKTISSAPHAPSTENAPKKSFFVEFPDEDIPKARRPVRAAPVKAVNQIHSPKVLNQQLQQLQQVPPSVPPKTTKTPPVNPYKPKSGTSPILQQHVPIIHQSGIAAPPSAIGSSTYAPPQQPPVAGSAPPPPPPAAAVPQAYSFPQQPQQQQQQHPVAAPPQQQLPAAPPQPPQQQYAPQPNNAYAPAPPPTQTQQPISPVNVYAQPPTSLQPLSHASQSPVLRNRQPSINTNVGKAPSQNSPYVPNAGPYAPSNQHNRTHSRTNSLVGGKGKEVNPYVPALQTVVSSEHTPQQTISPTGMIPPPARTRGFSNAKSTGGNIYKAAPKVVNPEQLNFRQFPIFSSSVGTKCVTVIPNAMYNNQVPNIVVQPISNILKDKEIYAEFPGPLIKGKSKKKDIEKWLELSSNYLRNSSKFDELLLNDILLHLIKNDGDVHNKEFLRDACKLLNPNINFEASEVISNFTGIVGATNAHKLDNSGINTVFSLIQTGNLSKACEYCISRGDWALALIVSGPDNFARVAAEYARNTFPFVKTNNKVMHIMPIILKVFAGNVSSIIEDLKAVPTEGEYANLHWREIIASVAISGTLKAGEFLVEFGRFLQSHGNLIGSELSFIMAGLPFNNTNFMALISGHNSMYTEVYEYAISLGKPLFFPHLLAAKLKHASTLADYGLINESQRYIDYINSSIKSLGNKSPFITPSLVHEFQNLIMRLTEAGSGDQGNWFSGTISKVNLDKIWGQIDKFIVGGEDSQQSGNPQSKSGKVDNGAFRNFSPSISRTASSINLPSVNNTPAAAIRGPILERKPTTGSMVPPQLAPPQLIARGSTNSVNKYSPGVANIDKYAPSPKQSSAFLQDHVNTSGLAYNQSPMPPYLPSNSQVGESPSTQRYDPPGAGNNKIYGYQIGAQNSTSSVASIGNINNNMHSSHQYHHHHHHNNNNNNQQPPSGSGNQYTPGHKKQFSGSSIVSGEGLGIDFSKNGDDKEVNQPQQEIPPPISSGAIVQPNGSPILQKKAFPPPPPPLGQQQQQQQDSRKSSTISNFVPSSRPSISSRRSYAPPPVAVQPNELVSLIPSVEQEIPDILEPVEDHAQLDDEIPGPPPPSSEPIIDVPIQEEQKQDVIQESMSAPQESAFNEEEQRRPSDVPPQSVSAPPQQPIHEVERHEEPEVEDEQTDNAEVPAPPPPPPVVSGPPPRRASKLSSRPNPYAPGGSSSSIGSGPKSNSKRNKYGPPPGVKNDPPAELTPDMNQFGGNLDSVSMFSYGGYSEPAQVPAIATEGKDMKQEDEVNPEVNVVESKKHDKRNSNVDDSYDEGEDEYPRYDAMKTVTNDSSTPLILNQGNITPNISMLSTPKNSTQFQAQHHTIEGFPIPGSPDDTTRPNSIMGNSRGGIHKGFFSSRLSESQSVLYQQYAVADDTVGDYIPTVEEEDEDEEDYEEGEDSYSRRQIQQQKEAEERERKRQQEKEEEEEERRKKQEAEEEAKRKKQEEDEAKRKKQQEQGKRTSLFSIFGSGKKQSGTGEGEKQVYKAHLGQKNTFVYDEKLKRWVDKSKPLEEQLAASAPPPPPPKMSKKPTPTSNSAAPPLPPMGSGGAAPPLTSSSSPSIGGPPLPRKNNNSVKPKKSLANAGLDDLLSLTEDGNLQSGSNSRASGAGNRRNKRRGYVNVMEK
ncbi:COPII coat assembly protein SEC16 [Candida tropicalis]